MPRFFRCLALSTMAAFLAFPMAAQQTAIPNYSEARQTFWNALYTDGFQELYCGKTVSERGNHNIEHVFPAYWMTRALDCGSRKTCRRTSQTFNRMEADLHNLWPVRTEVNSRRGSFPFGEVAGENHDFPSCDFEVSGGTVEPRLASRGEVARSVLYMASVYGAEGGMPAGQLELMRQWDQSDPPSLSETERNDLIEILQGTRNEFVDAHAPQISAQSTILARSLTTNTPAATTGERVRIATWNIANLHFENDKHLPGRPSAAKRTSDDFERLSRYIEGLQADIIAFQEVNGPQAARRIFPESEYDIIISNRFDEDLSTGQATDHIYTGIAVKKNGSVSFIAGDTYEELSVPHTENGITRPTRRGTEALVELPNGEPLQVLSIHLKSGCHQGRLDVTNRPDCETLGRQRAPLEAWIDDLTDANTPFVIAGDWNRRIDIHGQRDHIWEALDDGDPTPLDLFRYPEGQLSPCLEGTPDHRPKPIDFIVLDEQAALWADPESLRIVDFLESDKPERGKISNHCPVVIDLEF